MKPLYALGTNFVLNIELIDIPILDIDPWDESISLEINLPEIDDIATCSRQPLWCTELGIITPVNEVVDFNDPTYRLGIFWPESYRASIFAVDPGVVMYATELVIVQDDFPEFYVCSRW